MTATRLTRRTFLRRGAMAAGAAVALTPFSKALGANDDLRVAVVGFRGQGSLHIRLLRELPGVRVVALCDADRSVLERGVQEAHSRNERVAGYTDVRKLLEDKNIDAVTTATPDHWHSLVTIWACQAGKDVYVEKPLSHNLWEGRQAVAAARKYNRIVQFGNASHAQPTGRIQQEVAQLGRIQVVYHSLNRKRETIGKVNGPQAVPPEIDYDLWSGPAPLQPLMRKRLHYDWHWVWPTGTGELGNNGIYPLDAVRLALGQTVLPKRVMSLGGRFLFEDDGETPNAQIALFQYDPGPLVIFELRNFPSEKGPKSASAKVKCAGGESGLPDPTEPERNTGGHSAHKGHLFNFVSAVRSRNVGDLRADVLEGHLSTALVHMANISYRLGDEHTIDEVREAVRDRGSEAEEVLAGFQEHLQVNGVDFSQTKVVLGPWLEMDPQREQFVGPSELSGRANVLVHGQYRAPFVVPESV